MKKLIMAILSLFMITACSQKEEEPLTRENLITEDLPSLIFNHEPQIGLNGVTYTLKEAFLSVGWDSERHFVQTSKEEPFFHAVVEINNTSDTNYLIHTDNWWVLEHENDNSFNNWNSSYTYGYGDEAEEKDKRIDLEPRQSTELYLVFAINLEDIRENTFTLRCSQSGAQLKREAPETQWTITIEE